MYKRGSLRIINRRKFIVFLILVVGIGILLMKINIINKIKYASLPTNNSTVREPLLQNKEQNSESDLSGRNKIIADKNITIFLDAGHGGADSGTDTHGVLEKDINLDITLRLGELLKKLGINILYTRVNDDYISLKDRIELVNESNANFLISIHNNSFEDDTDVNGTSTLYFTNDKTLNDNFNSEKLAKIVQSELIEKLKTKDAGMILRKNLGILKLSKIPSIITEIAFLTNPTDREKLKQEEFRQNTAEAIASAVIKVIDKM